MSIQDHSKIQQYMNQLKMNENLQGIIKQLIVEKNNEPVYQFLDSTKDGNDLTNYLVLAILYDNLDIIKRIIEKHGYSINTPLFINPALIYLDSKENKESYSNVEVPLLILAAVSGSISVFDYLYKAGADIKQVGHICLSAKKKNSIVSNVIGAAAYYQRNSLLSYLLDNKEIRESNTKENGTTKNSLSFNYKATERKAKSNKNSPFVKEVTGYTPVMLCVISKEHSKVLSTVKTLMNKVNIKELDYEGNTLLHLAVKAQNAELVRFLVEEVNLNPKEVNSKKETPVLILNSLPEDLRDNNDSREIKKILEKFDKHDLEVTDNILSLFEKDDKKKKKKDKKNKSKEEDINFISSFDGSKIKTFDVDVKDETEKEKSNVKKDKPVEIVFDEGYDDEDEVNEIKQETNEHKAIKQKVTKQNIKNNQNRYDNYNSYDGYDNYTTYDNYDNNNYNSYNNYGYKNYQGEYGYNDYSNNYYNKGYNNYHKGNNYEYNEKNKRQNKKQNNRNSTKFAEVNEPVSENTNFKDESKEIKVENNRTHTTNIIEHDIENKKTNDKIIEESNNAANFINTTVEAAAQYEEAPKVKAITELEAEAEHTKQEQEQEQTSNIPLFVETKAEESQERKNEIDVFSSKQFESLMVRVILLKKLYI